MHIIKQKKFLKEVFEMTETILEDNLRAFDYSVLSKVKKSLLEEILQKQRKNNFKNFMSLSQQLADEKLSDDELDYVVAAGNPSTDKIIKMEK